MGAYTLGTVSLTYTLNLYVNGSISYNYGFPLVCRYPGDGFGFSPNTIGKYMLQLYSTHAVANITAWVIGARSGYSIRTNPVISNQFIPYSVIAKYFNPQGNTGGVAMDYVQTNLNTYLMCQYRRSPITNNQTTTFPYVSNSTTSEYWGLYAYANNYYGMVANCKHVIRLPSVYTHMFPGGDVRVYANSIYVTNVGDSQSFIFPFEPHRLGAFNLTMYLIQNDTTILLATTNFTVSQTDSQVDPNDEYGNMFSFIPVEYYPYIAVGIIMGFMLLPLSFIYGMNRAMSKLNVTVNVPAMVTMVLSVISALTGYVLTILLGLLDWWTVFVVIFIFVLVILFLYLKGGSSKE
jgi:hypothetical protein